MPLHTKFEYVINRKFALRPVKAIVVQIQESPDHPAHLLAFVRCKYAVVGSAVGSANSNEQCHPVMTKVHG